MNYKITLFLILLSTTSIISVYGQENRICPLGSYLGKDAFGNQACLDSHTNQVVSSPNLRQLPSSSNGSGNNGSIVGVVVVLIIIAIIAGIAKSRKKDGVESEKQGRRNFSQDVRDMILEKQEGRCAICGKHPSSFQFDHIDGNNSNNSPNNCQALCPNCHDRKSRDLN